MSGVSPSSGENFRRVGLFVGAMGAVGGLFEPGDDGGRAWDEAEAILVASEDLDAVMATIRDAESPVEARRALKLGFGFTGRQAALLLTLPVLSFTRSERERMHEGRRARMELLADVTGMIPVIREPVLDAGRAEVEAARPEAARSEPAQPEPSRHEPARPEPVHAATAPAEATSDLSDWGDNFDGTVDQMRSVMDQHYGVAPAPIDTGLHQTALHRTVSDRSASDQSTSQQIETHQPVAREPVAELVEFAEPVRRGRRSSEPDNEETSTVLDEQIAELCDAIAKLVGAEASTAAWSDDPRDSRSATGQLLDSCGIDDATGIRTLLWHLRRTGLDTVDGLLPFAEPLSGSRGVDVQSVRFETAMESGTLGPTPDDGATWTGRLWPIADKLGYGYAVHYRPGAKAGAVWAYGGGEPLHLLWDSVVDMLVELYQAFAAGEPCDAALAAVIDGRVVWSNLS